MEDVSELWNKFKADGDEDAKNELIMHYIFVVRSIVRRMMPKYNAFNEYDDLISTGVLGLIDAIDKFDPSREFKFETYAASRIRGEILDYMREQDWASPGLRRRITAVNKAYDELENMGDGEVSDEQLAKLSGIPIEQVRTVKQQTHIFNIISFEDTLNDNNAVYDIPSAPEDSPESQLLKSELREQLAGIISVLPERTRQIITMYYYENFRLQDIADILGITEGRVSQILSRTLEKMRQQLGRL